MVGGCTHGRGKRGQASSGQTRIMMAEIEGEDDEESWLEYRIYSGWNSLSISLLILTFNTHAMKSS